MIWTHLTTLDEEKTYIWSKDVGLTWNKALFAAVRYISTVTFGFVRLEFKFPRFFTNITGGCTVSVSYKYVPI